MVSYDGKVCEYDSIGNPYTYMGNTLVWKNGRQLAQFGDIATFEYNSNGIRTSKTANGTTTKFYLSGSKILRQEDSSGNCIDFIYGAGGVVGFRFNDKTYYYRKNLLGDVIGIFDDNRQQITKYTYKSWGEHEIKVLYNNTFIDIEEYKTYNINSNDNIKVSELNPFRYRSYYYDIETKLYYLKSRYYDSETGRFINADDIVALDVTSQAINGINLYVYCLNNPINEIDESGYFIIWLFLVAVVAGAVIGAGTEIIAQGIEKGWDNINWSQVGWSGLIGGLGGALMVSGVGSVGMTILGGGIGFISSVGEQIINGKNLRTINWLNVGFSTFIGMIPGLFGSKGVTNYKVLDSALSKSQSFINAASSYDKVLTKIANNAYRSLSGAAGARTLTRITLQNVWESVIKSKSWMGLGIKVLGKVGTGILKILFNLLF